ncbi:MAG: DNA polymerase I [Deltaproteobacteria bacterium]|nr:DNA polymerase I [Deltaproteobacteria bacterium]
MKTLYLIDISSFIFRAYYAVRPLSTKEGIPVNAVFGVVSMINRLIENNRPDYIVVCKDRPDKGFRHAIFPQYKANRSLPPEDLVPQFELIHEFIQTYPILAIDRQGYEADDVIASLVHQCKADSDLKIFIVSSDKDLMQLVDDRVFLYDSMKDSVIKREAVIAKFGVPPERVVDVQSLSGDPVDNIPGVAGVGVKTAAKLINEFGDLENVLNNADHIKGKIGEKIRGGRANALLSKKLVTLASDIDLHVDWEGFKIKPRDVASLNQFYKRLEFNKFIIHNPHKAECIAIKHEGFHVWRYAPDTTRGALRSDMNDFMSGAMRQTPARPPRGSPLGVEKTFQGSSEGPAVEITGRAARFERQLIDTEDHLRALVHVIRQQRPEFIAFDTETDSLQSVGAGLVGVSLCCDPQRAYYIPVGHKQGHNIPLQKVKDILGPLLSDPDFPKAAQNAKFDLNVLAGCGISVFPVVDDTLIASYLIDASGQHNLDYLAAKYLDYRTIKFSDLVLKGMTFADVEIEKAMDYAAEDAWVVHQLVNPLRDELQKFSLTNIYDTLEIPLIPVLAQIEQNGVFIDVPFLNQLHLEFESRLKGLEDQIYHLAGEVFNIQSPKQLAVILFERLKLPVVKKTKTGYSTDVDVLEELAHQHNLPKSLLEYRTVAKLLSTYVVQLKNLIHTRTGRVHTHYNQAIVTTGRLSSTEPNLQNIPVRTEEGRRIRQSFIAPEGAVIFSADYSQIELRLLAAFSKDRGLTDAYCHDQDIHAKTASHIFGMPLDAVTPELRGIGKTINFGVVYGQSPYGLSKQLGVPLGEAKAFIDGFYREFSQVGIYKHAVLAEARRTGYVTTYRGRRRCLPELNSQNTLSRQNAERAAFNTVFQGSAADLIKEAMIVVQGYLFKNNLRTKMIMQVHDELVFEVPHDELKTVLTTIPAIMESVFTLDVPLKVSASYGSNWASAH